jgi:hypothetical protein
VVAVGARDFVEIGDDDRGFADATSPLFSGGARPRSC